MCRKLKCFSPYIQKTKTHNTKSQRHTTNSRNDKMTFFNNDNYDWSGLIQHLDEQEQEQPEPTTTTTTTTTTTYEFLPEIWNKIKEYSIVKEYKYDEKDCVFKVKIPLTVIVDGYDKEMYDRLKLVVSGDGQSWETTTVQICVPEEGEDAYFELQEDEEEYELHDGCCDLKFNTSVKAAEYWLSEVVPDYPDTDGMNLVVELGERGYTKYLTTEGGERIV